MISGGTGLKRQTVESRQKMCNNEMRRRIHFFNNKNKEKKVRKVMCIQINTIIRQARKIKKKSIILSLSSHFPGKS